MAEWDPKANELFLRALEIDSPRQRQAFLNEQCGEDGELRRRVEALLDAHQQAGSFLEHPPLEELAVEPDGGRRGAQPSGGEHPTLPSGPDPAPPAGAQPGTRVRYVGDYELLEEIGRGGMGVVYKARQVSLDRTVAVKMIAARQLASEADLARFRAEAQAAAQLQHPNIVAIHEVGQHEGQPYFSMDYVEGPSLAEIVRDKPLAPRQAAQFVRAVAEAIAFAHQRGVIHRDLKPANILIDRDGQPKVTDFGLAKRMEAESGLTGSGQILGTPEFMAPEQASGKSGRIGPAADIYALGAVLYTLLTGRPPFQAATPLDTILQVLDDEPVAPRQLNRAIPRDLETICLKCLEKEPQQRYQTAQELADDLGRFLADEPIRARRVGPAERAVRWLRRQRRSVALAVSAAIAAAVLVLAGIAGWLGYQRWQLGYLTIRTDALTLVADIIDEEDRVVVSRAGIPTDEPVAVPAGDYRIRVMGRGTLSDDFRMLVQRGQQHTIDLSLEQRQLWDPIKVDSAFEVVELADHADIILVKETGLVRVDGRTAERAWETTFPDKTGAEDPLQGIAWNWKRVQWSVRTREYFGAYNRTGYPDRRPRLVQPAVDVNGDGIGDLVFALQTQAALVTVCGATGQVLWTYRSSAAGATDDVANAPAKRSNERPSAAVGTSCGADVDDDGVADIIVTSAEVAPYENARWENDPRRVISDAVRWVEAVSGRTGKMLWHRELDASWFALPPNAPLHGRAFAGENQWVVYLRSLGRPTAQIGASSGNVWPRRTPQDTFVAFNWVHVPFPPEVFKAGSQELVGLVAGTRLVVLKLKNGEPARAAIELGFVPLRSPVYGDLNGDGRPEAVLLRGVREPDKSRTEGQGGQPNRILLGRRAGGWRTQVIAVDLASGQQLWSTEVKAKWKAYWAPPDEPPDWPILVDLDDPPDGRCEVILPDGRPSRSHAALVKHGYPFDLRERYWGGVSVLNGADGTLRWNRVVKTLDLQLHRMVAGPDVDGDSVRDVFAASLVADAEKLWLFVDAFSGKDGRTIWWWSERLPDRVTKSGSLSGVLEGIGLGPLRWWQTGTDGWPQLVVSYTPRQAGGTPAVYVLSAGSGKLMHVGLDLRDPRLADLNGDGEPDLYAFRPKRADRWGQPVALEGTVSGISGHSAGWQRLWAGLLGPAGDLNGDVIEDLLAKETSPAYSGPPWGTFALSGRDGSLLWRTKQSVVLDDSYLYFATLLAQRPISADLDGDGVPEMFAKDARRQSSSPLLCSDVNGDRTPDLVVLESSSESKVSALSGRTGRAVWSTRLGKSSADQTAVANSRHAYDLLSRYLLLSGRDGRVLWEQPLGLGLPIDLFGEAYHYVHPEVQDLNGDGTPDVLLPVIASETQAELHAVSGDDGRLLWKHVMAARENSFYLFRNLPFPATGDLDGDGQPEVVILDYELQPNADPATSPKTLRVSVLSGSDGKPKWKWEEQVHAATGRVGREHAYLRPIPLIVNLQGGEHPQRGVCIWTWASTGAAGSIILLDSMGHPLWRKQVKPPPPYLYEGQYRVWACDLDGDRADELVYPALEITDQFQRGRATDQAQIVAAGASDGQPLWQWPLPGRSGVVVGVEATHGANQATVLVRAGSPYSDVYALDGPTGRVRWQSDPKLTSEGAWYALALLASPGDSALPRLIYRPLVERDSTAHAPILCRLPMRRDGAAEPYQLPRLITEHAAQVPDPRLIRPAPWTHMHGVRIDWHDIGESTIPFVLLLLVPGLALVHLVRHRRFSLRALLLVPLYLAVVVGFFAFDPGGLAVPLSRVLAELPEGGVLAGPILVMLWVLVRAVRRGRWGTAAFVAGAFVAVASVFGAWLVWLDLPYREPWEQYDWSAGWLNLAFAAAWLTGLLVVALVCIVFGVRLMRPHRPSAVLGRKYGLR